MATAQTLPPRLTLNGSDRRQPPDETALLRRLDELYDEGEEVREKHAPKKETERDLRLYRGEVGPKDRDPYFEANFIEAFIDRMVAQLTDNRPILRVEHRKAGLRQMAEVTTKVAQAVWDEEKMQRQSFKMAHSAAIERCAGLYTGFDSVTDQIVLEVLQKDQVVIDPAVTEAALVGQAEYVFITRERPVEALKYRFPGRGASVKPDTTTGDPENERKGRRVLSALFDTMRNKAGSADALGRATVTECLVVDRQRSPDGTPMFPRGRMVIRTADLVLSDGPNPYWDGEFPLDWFDWGVDPKHPWGRSEARRLMRMQLAFNQLIDGLVENQLLTNFIQVVADWDALEETAWKKLQKLSSSLILRKRNRNAALQVLPPPPFGADKIQLGRAIFTFAQLLTGVTDVTLGETAGSLQSGQAIEGLQEGANLMTRSRASRIEDFYMRVGQKLISRIFQFFPSDRVVHLVGPTAAAIDYAVKRTEWFVDDDGKEMSNEARARALQDLRFVVSPGSSAPGSRIRRAEMMLKLFAATLAPGVDVLRAADFPEPEELFKRAQEEAAKRSPDILQQIQKMVAGS